MVKNCMNPNSTQQLPTKIMSVFIHLPKAKSKALVNKKIIYNNNRFINWSFTFTLNNVTVAKLSQRSVESI